MYYWYDWYSYILFILPALIISIYAQMKVQTTYSKYEKMKNSRGLTGAVIARSILDSNGLRDVRIERIPGKLSDHFDPRANVVRLSAAVYDGTSVASCGVAAHEVGHAIQYAQDYTPMKIRGAIIPVTQFGSMAWIPLFLLGMFLSMPALTYFGIILFSLTAVFQLVTLPVEFNASNRALYTLKNENYLTLEELKGSQKVLSAAALTYVAALLMSLLQLLRLILISGRRN